MNIISPSLEIQEVATDSLIEEVVTKLAERDDPFAILEEDEQTYMQVLWTVDGYDLEYQERDIMHHFRLAKLVTAQKAIWALQSYLGKDGKWKEQLEFVGKDITGLGYRMGYAIGQFFGRIKRSFERV